MRRRVARLLALCVVAMPAAAHAQDFDGSSTLEGTARDAASGRAVTRAWVCATIQTGPRAFRAKCGHVDSAGSYRLDSLPAGKWPFSLNCGTMSVFGRSLTTDSITVANGATVRRDWVVDTTGCDPRPLRRVAGTFRGHWTPGFESSEFVPCAADAWFVPGDSLKMEPYDQRFAWATLRDGALAEDFEWPKAPEDEFGYSTYYVQWRGTVVGPGRYGHLGVASFEMEVDSVLALRAPRRGDCPPVSPGATETLAAPSASSCGWESGSWTPRRPSWRGSRRGRAV